MGKYELQAGNFDKAKKMFLSSSGNGEAVYYLGYMAEKGLG